MPQLPPSVDLCDAQASASPTATSSSVTTPSSRQPTTADEHIPKDSSSPTPRPVMSKKRPEKRQKLDNLSQHH
ncbi:unnamed protein product [Sympodiomycopsis kandeliae]